MRASIYKVIIKHSCNLFDEQGLLNKAINDIPLDLNEIHITKGIALFAVKVNQENTSLTVIIDKNIIQFTFKEQTDFSVIKIILNCFPEEFTNSLKSPILVVDGYIEKSIDMENYNNLFNENSRGYSFNLKHFGVEFNTKSYSYRITSTIRKKDIKMVIRIPLKKDNFNLEEDIHLAKTGLYDEVLPEFNKFIRSERK